MTNTSEHSLTIEEFIEQLTPAEFIRMAETEKIKLLDSINAWQNVASFETAKAKRAYYRVWKGRKDDSDVQILRSEYEYWNQVWEGLKHTTSALQSTLKAERELNQDHSGE